jgi:LysM repeat protein
MKIEIASGCPRALILSIIGLVAPLLLTQCKSSVGSYKEIEYDPATLKTPSGHGMVKRDYPFDDEGNYRKDWVRSKTTGKARSASKLPDPIVSEPPSISSDGGQSVAATDNGLVPGNPSGHTHSHYVGPATATGAVAAAPSASPVPPPAPVATASPQYHKVQSGDTLFSLAGRYGTSVGELRRINGLSGDMIRSGQSLRLP